MMWYLPKNECAQSSPSLSFLNTHIPIYLSSGSSIQARSRSRVKPLVPSLTVWLLAAAAAAAGGGGGDSALERVNSCSSTASNR